MNGLPSSVSLAVPETVISGTPARLAIGSMANIWVPKIGAAAATGLPRSRARCRAVTATSGEVAVSDTS